MVYCCQSKVDSVLKIKFREKRQQVADQMHLKCSQICCNAERFSHFIFLYDQTLQCQIIWKMCNAKHVTKRGILPRSLCHKDFISCRGLSGDWGYGLIHAFCVGWSRTLWHKCFLISVSWLRHPSHVASQTCNSYKKALLSMSHFIIDTLTIHVFTSIDNWSNCHCLHFG